MTLLCCAAGSAWSSVDQDIETRLSAIYGPESARHGAQVSGVH